MDFKRLASWHALFLAAAGVGCGGSTHSDELTNPGGSSGEGGGTARGGAGGGTAVGGGGVTVGGSGGSSGGTGGVATCDEPMPLLSTDTGYFRCAQGFYHRAEKRECPSSLPRSELPASSDPTPMCNADTDCVEFPHGFCSDRVSENFTLLGRACQYGCVRDEDCGLDSICLCGDPVGTCVPASCTTDADCESGLCAGTPNLNVCTALEYVAFACQAPGDECSSYADCGGPNQTCLLASPRVCQSSGVCGRPFLVDGVARTASLEPGGQWQAALRGEASGLPAAVRAELSRHYGRVALLEHASVAAFARFILELLALGAPAALVHDAERALRDEIRHAELCFAVAGRCAGSALGPGPLPIEGALRERSWRTVVATAIREARIGETLAAIEATSAAQAAADPELAAVLHGIAEDETRHAELGWRFVRWALVAGPAELVEVVAAEFEAAIEQQLAELAEPGPEPPAALARVLREHGVLPDDERARLQRAALEYVVQPVARELAVAASRAGTMGDELRLSA